MGSNIFLRAAAVLLCLTALSACLLSGMLARYTAVGSGGGDARVAHFGQLTLTESTTDYSLIPGTTVTKDPKISMTASEVAVRVYVMITAPGCTRTGNTLTHDLFIATLADGWIYDDKSGDTFTFYRDLAPNTDLNVSVFQGDAISVPYEIPYTDYYTNSSALTLTVTARAEQID